MTSNQKTTTLAFLVLLFIFVFIDPVYAGPGGVVAKALFKTWWGKLLLFLIAIVLFPLIIYIKFREYFAVKKCKKELKKLQQINDDFRWSKLEKTVKQIFERVYVAWSKEDMSTVSNFVSHWYWQNQQLVYLDKWKSENLKNICDLEHVGKIRPLHLEIVNNDNLEGSRIAFAIEGRIKDYLVDRETHKIRQGKSGYSDEEKVWIFEYSEGKWLLDDIRESDLTLAFAKLENVIPTDLPYPITQLK